MTDVAVGSTVAGAAAEHVGILQSLRSIDWTAVVAVSSVLGGLAIAVAQFPSIRNATHVEPWQRTALFGVWCLLGVASALGKAVQEHRFSAGPNKQLNHISGWSFLAFVGAIVVIVVLANWAASSSSVNHVIHAQWGGAVVIGVAGAFFFAALTPSEEFLRKVGSVFSPITSVIKVLGGLLSGIDALLVFGVAGAAGATRNDPYLRYFLLFGSLVPCAWLGYSLDAPWGLIPIAWGSLIAVSMSRAWAWVEDDRDVAMLSQKYTGDHLRIGFGQDLRDEALFSFMALFFLVPLALRQCQLTADAIQVPLFEIKPGTSHGDLGQWVAYYGTELAKAVPFVDWAEVYHVEGDANISPGDYGPARHVVFATRVLVDLVLLAALLQALSLSARNSKQRDLFARKEIQLLDPFTEPREFRKLRMRVDGIWRADPDKIKDFPLYNGQRLAELADEARHPDIACVAIALRRRDGLDNVDRSEEFHTALLERANAKRKDPAAIDAALSAIQIAKASVNIPVLAEVRRLLNAMPAMNGVRERLMRMVERAPPSEQRNAAVREALEGTDRDTIAAVREVATRGLQSAIRDGGAWARELVVKVAASDGAQRVRQTAAELARQYGVQP